MDVPNNQPTEHHVPEPGESSVPELEEDETVAPRPEEAIADVLRAQPDVTDHRRGAVSRGEHDR
ncbi:hypothetical protein [Microbacterium sp. NPDC058345]|uniref:hypothetical protein n=1 Tax=Microbacterium sp. NPDC058345 TaxID=3346455 RepID=UPI0036533CAC